MKKLTTLLCFIALVGCAGKDPQSPVVNNVSLARPEIEFGDVSGQWIMVESSEGWEVTLEFEEEGSDWASFTGATSGSGNGMVKLSNVSNDGDALRKVDIVVDFESGEQKRATLTQNFNEGGIVPPPPPQDNRVYNWTELPRVDTDGGKMYVKHFTTLNGKEVRNFSMLYDPSVYMAHWVAYPLHGCYIGEEDRSEAWGYDPLIPQEFQPDLTVSYSSGGDPYQRGHQVPSADRTKTVEMNSHTFYYSNMTPQQSSLNGSRWARLESKLRTIVRNNAPDTMWVVTGMVLRTVGGSEEIETIVNRRNSSQIMPVPNYYFKVAVMRKNGVYKGIGFWFDHRDRSQDSGSNVSTNARRIDQIEELTGFDFFVNLSESEQVDAEASVDTAFWGI